MPVPVQAAPDFTAGALAIHFQNQEVTVLGEPVKLTPVEYKLLYHLVRNVGHLMPHQALLDRVWGLDFEGSSNVMEVYIGYLRAKLEAEGEPRLIHTVRGVGYVFKD